jgi:hypothetical protein
VLFLDFIGDEQVVAAKNLDPGPLRLSSRLYPLLLAVVSEPVSPKKVHISEKQLLKLACWTKAERIIVLWLPGSNRQRSLVFFPFGACSQIHAVSMRTTFCDMCPGNVAAAATTVVEGLVTDSRGAPPLGVEYVELVLYNWMTSE